MRNSTVSHFICQGLIKPLTPAIVSERSNYCRQKMPEGAKLPPLFSGQHTITDVTDIRVDREPIAASW